MNYTTKDFSPIRGPDEKPVKVGWYVTCVAYSTVISSWSHPLLSDRYVHLFEFWDGRFWIRDGSVRLHLQNQYWFGLNKKAKK